jgi:hypothetical protein
MFMRELSEPIAAAIARANRKSADADAGELCSSDRRRQSTAPTTASIEVAMSGGHRQDWPAVGPHEVGERRLVHRRPHGRHTVKGDR